MSAVKSTVVPLVCIGLSILSQMNPAILAMSVSDCTAC